MQGAGENNRHELFDILLEILSYLFLFKMVTFGFAQKQLNIF
jgi:hypothetical protein